MGSHGFMDVHAYLSLLALHNFSILFYFILRQAAPFTDPEAREFG